jgi:Sulfotransferase family/Glycosyl transferase family 2
MPTICAIVAAHNAAKTLGSVLEHLEQNCIRVHFIDHGSTDRTAQIVAQYMGAPVIDITHQEFDGVFRLSEQLELKDAIVKNLTDDWVIHSDADEILESPNEGESLREMIERLDKAGFDIIDCDEFVFAPVEKASESQDFVNEMRHYYHFSPIGRTLHRAQRRASTPSKWSLTGGHKLSLVDQKLAPERIRLRHYIGLSLDHLRSQYLGRVFAGEELQRGWHYNRVATTQDFVVNPEISRLLNVDVDGWRTDKPEQSHLVFHQPHGYQRLEKLAASDSHRPFPFIVGVGRSGTTLLRLLLDAHPKIAVTPETHWLRGVVRKLLADPRDIVGVREEILSEPHWADMGIYDHDLDNIIASHKPERPGDTLRRIYRLYASRHHAERVGDKTPLHNLAMHDIARILPEAHFIHIIRDGRDVALSYRDLWFGPGRDVRAAAMLWMWRIRETRQQAQFLPHYLEVRYEALVSDPEKVLRTIAHFIDLPFDPVQLTAHLRAEERLRECQDFVHYGRKITAEQRRELHKLTSSPPDASRVERWASLMDPTELAKFERIAGDMLTDLGYARATSERPV